LHNFLNHKKPTNEFELDNFGNDTIFDYLRRNLDKHRYGKLDQSFYHLRLIDAEILHHVYGVNEISRFQCRSLKKNYSCSKLDLQRRETLGYIPNRKRRVKFRTKVFNFLAGEHQNPNTLDGIEALQRNCQSKDPFVHKNVVYRKTCFLDYHFFNQDSLVIEEIKVLKSRSGTTNTGFRFTFSIKNPSTFRLKNLPNKIELEIDRVFSLQNDGKTVKVFGKKYSSEDILTEHRQRNNDHVIHRDDKEIHNIHVLKYFSSKGDMKRASKDKKLSKLYKFRDNSDFTN